MTSCGMVLEVEYLHEKRFYGMHVKVDARHLFSELPELQDLLDELEEGGLGLAARVHALQVAPQEVVVRVLRTNKHIFHDPVLPTTNK